jgi:intraflagellar transport protein 46
LKDLGVQRYGNPASTSTSKEQATSKEAHNPPPLEEGTATFPGGYDAAKYTNLPVDPALKELFKYIDRYKPEKSRLVSELKPFIPEYIAATGDVDEFLKPPRPDGKFEPLGLRVLDEPSVKQSDPAIMRKFLKANLKGTAGVEDIDENAIEHSDEDRANKIQQWIRSVEELHEKEIAGEVRQPPLCTMCVAFKTIRCYHTITAAESGRLQRCHEQLG